MSDDDREPTDAEHVEYVRQAMQGAMDRADFKAPTQTDMLNSCGLPQKSVTVRLEDLTEIGRFDITPPPHAKGWPDWVIKTFCRTWVYKHTDGSVHAIGLRKRLELKATGRADIWAMIKRPEGQED